ncbi:hypothetical protein ACR8H4_19310, partial [Salmonella enterica subsp. enterica serovar Paratyphi A]
LLCSASTARKLCVCIVVFPIASSSVQKLLRAVGSGHQTVKLGEFAFLTGNKLASGMNSWSHFQIKKAF